MNDWTPGKLIALAIVCAAFVGISWAMAWSDRRPNGPPP